MAQKRVFVELDSTEIAKASIGSRITEFDPGKVAWGGIGGSGKHAAELLPEIAEVAKSPESFRALVLEATKISNDPEFAKLDLGKVAWGGIGGSGKHASELLPEQG